MYVYTRFGKSKISPQSDPAADVSRPPHQCARFMPRRRQHPKELGDLGGKQQIKVVGWVSWLGG